MTPWTKAPRIMPCIAAAIIDPKNKTAIPKLFCLDGFQPKFERNSPKKQRNHHHKNWNIQQWQQSVNAAGNAPYKAAPPKTSHVWLPSQTGRMVLTNKSRSCSSRKKTDRMQSRYQTRKEDIHDDAKAIIPLQINGNASISLTPEVKAVMAYTEKVDAARHDQPILDLSEWFYAESKNKNSKIMPYTITSEQMKS